MVGDLESSTCMAWNGSFILLMDPQINGWRVGDIDL